MLSIELPVYQTRRINSAAYSVSQTGCLHPDRILNEHDLLYIQRGQWEVLQDDHAYILNPGDIILLAANRHHFGRIPSKPGTQWAWIHFEFLPGDRLVDENSPADSTRRPIDEEDMVARLPYPIRTNKDSHATDLFERIIYSHRSTIAQMRKQARVYLLELLLEFSRQHNTEIATSASFVERIVHYIERNPKRTDSLDELADLAGVSRRLLTKEFRKATGQSIRQFQLDWKVRLAKTHLRHNPVIGLRELANLLGFHDEFHFSRCFKNRTGVSPSRYRLGDGKSG
jgi:AraC-like DNA-binding protein